VPQSSLPFSLRQLQYFVAVAEFRSFRRAAESCHVSQPSLSAQIAELEKGLGVSLFERNSRRVILTAVGEALLPRTRAVLVAAADLRETARRHVDPFSGTLRIGVIPTIGPYLLPRIVPRLLQAFPALALHWVEDKTETLVRKIQQGEMDAAILALEADLESLEHEVLTRDEFVLATPASHHLGQAEGPARLGELSGE
jgi:LysR family hydrogen peroxide-inducible transcriptional activator